MIAFKLNYKTPPAEVIRLATHLRRTKSPRSPLVYCDGNDEMTIQWPELLRHCDLYWKKHVFRDRSRYLRPYRGSTNLTDFALGDEAEVPDWQSPPDETQLEKIVCGSSIGLDQKIAKLAPLLAENAVLPPRAARKFDIVLRANIPDDWSGKFRRPAGEALQSLSGRFAVLLPQGRVAQDQYAGEMMESRVCLSPFGYGEICWRDFEAITFGCLLFKPSMDHVESRPDIFKPFETYVPLAWDFSDLGEKLDHYLGHPEESDRMVIRARQILRECLKPEWYEGVVGEMLDRLVHGPSGSTSPVATTIIER